MSAQKENVFDQCLFNFEKLQIANENNIENMSFIPGSAKKNGQMKIYNQRMNFTERVPQPLHPVMECEEEDNDRKSSFLNQQFSLLSRSKEVDQFYTQLKEDKNHFYNSQSNKKNKLLFSQKSNETLSFQLSQIKVDKEKEKLIQIEMEEEAMNVDVAAKLAELNWDQSQARPSNVENEQQSCNINQWFQDEAFSNEQLDGSDENSSFDSLDGFTINSWNDVPQFHVKKLSVNQVKRAPKLHLSHFTPKKNDYYKIKPDWGWSEVIIKYIQNLNQDRVNQRQNAQQVFGVLSEISISQNFKRPRAYLKEKKSSIKKGSLDQNFAQKSNNCERNKRLTMNFENTFI